MRYLIIRHLILAAAVTCAVSVALPALADEVFLENLTTSEIAARQKQGSHRLIIYVGSTEQNGQHLVVGKHNRIAHHLAGEVARSLGDALVYPVLPFAPTGDPAKRTGHMAWPGSISLRPETFSVVITDLVLSGVANGFKRIYLMGDHGESQDTLSAIALTVDTATRAHGIRIHYLPEAYQLGEPDLQSPAQEERSHAGPEDTAMLLAIEPAPESWVRREKHSAPRQSIADGRRLLDQRTRKITERIRRLDLDS